MNNLQFLEEPVGQDQTETTSAIDFTFPDATIRLDPENSARALIEMRRNLATRTQAIEHAFAASAGDIQLATTLRNLRTDPIIGIEAVSLLKEIATVPGSTAERVLGIMYARGEVTTEELKEYSAFDRINKVANEYQTLLNPEWIKSAQEIGKAAQLNQRYEIFYNAPQKVAQDVAEDVVADVPTYHYFLGRLIADALEADNTEKRLYIDERMLLLQQAIDAHIDAVPKEAIQQMIDSFTLGLADETFTSMLAMQDRLQPLDRAAMDQPKTTLELVTVSALRNPLYRVVTLPSVLAATLGQKPEKSFLLNQVASMIRSEKIKKGEFVAAAQGLIGESNANTWYSDLKEASKIAEVDFGAPLKSNFIREFLNASEFRLANIGAGFIEANVSDIDRRKLDIINAELRSLFKKDPSEVLEKLSPLISEEFKVKISADLNSRSRETVELSKARLAEIAALHILTRDRGDRRGEYVKAAVPIIYATPKSEFKNWLWKIFVEDSRPEVKIKTLEALSRDERPPSQGIGRSAWYLVEVMQHDGGKEGLKAAIGLIGNRDPAILQSLMLGARSSNKDSKVKYNSILALSGYEPAYQLFTEVLNQDPNPRLGAAAIAALAGSEYEPAIKAMIKICKEGNQDTRSFYLPKVIEALSGTKNSLALEFLSDLALKGYVISDLIPISAWTALYGTENQSVLEKISATDVRGYSGSDLKWRLNVLSKARYEPAIKIIFDVFNTDYRSKSVNPDWILDFVDKNTNEDRIKQLFVSAITTSGKLVSNKALGKISEFKYIPEVEREIFKRIFSEGKDAQPAVWSMKGVHRSEEMVQALLKIGIRDMDPGVREMSVMALRGVNTEDVVNALDEVAMQDPSVAVRRVAVGVLRGNASPAALGVLERKGLKDSDLTVQFASSSSLSVAIQKEVQSRIILKLSDSSEEVRVAAVDALSRSTDSDTLLKILELGISDPSNVVRNKCVLALRDKQIPEIEAALSKLLRSDELEKRKFAVEALEGTTDSDTLDYIASLLEDPEEDNGLRFLCADTLIFSNYMPALPIILQNAKEVGFESRFPRRSFYSLYQMQKNSPFRGLSALNQKITYYD